MNTQRGNISIIISVVVVVALIVGIVYAIIKTKVASAPLNTAVQAQPVAPTVVAPATNPTNTQATTSTKTPMEQIAKNGDTLVMNYTGRLENGTVFDSNVDPKFGHVQPFEFKLGAGMVIKGWDEGLVGMKVGEKKTLTITPDKGYGATGMPPAIPPNATLIFDVELVGIK